MPDWNSVVRRRMAGLKLPHDAKELVIAELAAHLEDCGDDANEPVAPNFPWRKLSRDIQRAKSEGDEMNRTKTLWIPVFVNLLLTSALINICNWLGWIDVTMAHSGHRPPTLQPWLLTLPICGATAALLARRSQASSTVRVLAAVAPSLAWLASVPVTALIFLCFPRVFALPPFSSLAFAAMGWFVLPSLALFLGAVPFLRTSVFV